MRKIFLVIFLAVLSTNARAGWLKELFSECYSSSLQVRAKYERCQDLGTAYSAKLNQNVWTLVCSTSDGDKFVDFIVKDYKYCRTFRQD